MVQRDALKDAEEQEEHQRDVDLLKMAEQLDFASLHADESKLPLEEKAAKVIKRFTHRWKARKMAEREMEHEAFLAFQADRGFVVALGYIVLGLYIAVSLFLVLVYSVKFNKEQSQSWMNSVLIAYLMGAFVNEVQLISLHQLGIGVLHFTGLSAKIVTYMEKRKEARRKRAAEKLKKENEAQRAESGAAETKATE